MDQILAQPCSSTEDSKPQLFCAGIDLAGGPEYIYLIDSSRLVPLITCFFSHLLSAFK